MPVAIKAKKRMAKKPSTSLFSKLVLGFEAKGASNTDATVRASRVYSKVLRSYDRANPDQVNSLFGKGLFDALYFRHIAKYYPRMSEAKIRRLGTLVQEAEQARKKLENPRISVKEKAALREKIFEFRDALRYPELLSEQQKSHAKSSIGLIEKRLLNRQLKPGEQAFYKFIANNPGAIVARNKLTKAGLRLAGFMAGDLFNRKRPIFDLAGMTLGDAIQEASVGFIDAAKRFNPDKGVKFSTYAAVRVRGHVLGTLRDKALLVRLPRNVINMVSNEAAFADARAELYEKIGKAPTEKVKRAAMSRLAELSGARAAVTAVSGNEPVSGKDREDIGEIFDTVPYRGRNPTAEVEARDLRQKLSQALSILPGKSGRVLEMRFLSDNAPMSQAETATALGVSYSRASQMQSDAIRWLLVGKPELMQRLLGEETPVRRGEPTPADINRISKRLNEIFTGSKKKRR